MKHSLIAMFTPSPSGGKKDGVGSFDKDDVRWVVDAELDYGETQSESTK